MDCENVGEPGHVMDETANCDASTPSLRRDKTAAIMFGAAIVLIVLLTASVIVVARRGFAHDGLLEVALLLTGMFAVAGIVLGLGRSLRSGRAK